MPATKEEREILKRTQAQQGGEALRRIRESKKMTLRAVETVAYNRLGEFLTNQQVQRIERARVDSPDFRDVCLLATLYESSPNGLAELYDYWHPTAPEDVTDPRIRLLLSVLPTLPAGVRNDLLAQIEGNVALAQMKAATLR